MSFREARGGPVAFFSAEGKKIEIDERPFLDRALEDFKRAGEAPLRSSIADVATWLGKLSHTERFTTDMESDGKPEALLGELAMLSQIILNSTLLVIQPKTER